MESICIEDRKTITLVGASKVISSTSTQAVVEVTDNNVVITGNNIEVTKLDLENKEVIFSGDIFAIKYSNKIEKTNLFKKLFK